MYQIWSDQPLMHAHHTELSPLVNIFGQKPPASIPIVIENQGVWKLRQPLKFNIIIHLGAAPSRHAIAHHTKMNRMTPS